MGSGDQIQGVKLGSNHLYILSHLAGPFPFLVIDCLPILALVGLKLTIFLLLPPDWWDYPPPGLTVF